MGDISRRDFIKSGIGAAAFMVVPNIVLGKSHGHVAPSDKLNIAGIGVGGMGRRNLRNMNTENIVALCDVDWRYANKTVEDYPKAKRYKDWRKMFDEMGKEIDAIMVATPDHTHAGVAAHAITLGKHTYVQKPLTHSVYESRLLAKLAKKYKENRAVIHAIEAHHNDVEPQTLEAIIVQAADAISGSRPGARRESLENYVKRLEKLEGIANSFAGVEQSYAIQAGREVRVIVKPEQVDDASTIFLAKDIAAKVESELEYPGQIKVSVIRETRSIEFAK